MPGTVKEQWMEQTERGAKRRKRRGLRGNGLAREDPDRPWRPCDAFGFSSPAEGASWRMLAEE